MFTDLLNQPDFERFLERSNTDPVFIFKHSTQCSISNAVLEECSDFLDKTANVQCGLVLVIEHRNVSNAVARHLGVRHESPQAILIDKGRQTWNASHWSITPDSLREALGA